MKSANYQQVEIWRIVKLRGDGSPRLILTRRPLPLDPGGGEEAGGGGGERAGESQQPAGRHRQVVPELSHLARFLLLVNNKEVNMKISLWK